MHKCYHFIPAIISLMLWQLPLFAQNEVIAEAEIGTLSGVTLSQGKSGFSGDGYVSGFDVVSDHLEIFFEIESAGLHKIEMVYANNSSSNTFCQMQIDNEPYGEIRLFRSDSFARGNIGTYEFTEGIHTLRITFGNAPLEPDYFVLTPVDELPGISLDEILTRVEAEEGVLFGTRVEFGTAGYSGRGYVSSFDNPDTDHLRILVNAPEARDYWVTLGFATPYGYKENYLQVNGGPQQVIQFEERNTFGEVSAGKITLQEGLNTIDINYFWGWFELDYLEFNQVIGLAPEALSQGNILLNDDLLDGVETVTLDGSGSSDPDGSVVDYIWTDQDDSILGMESMFDHTFPVGTHQINLTVRDDEGNIGSTDFVVIIADLENQRNNRLSIRGGADSLFMSGMNIAWTSGSNFAKDLINYNQSTWITILDDIERAGGNAIRWWLHTNGSVSPLFGTDGKVSGLRETTIGNMRKVLDLAYERGIMVSLCLWSFDMLQNQGQDLGYTRMLLEDSLSTLSYIDNALIPMVEALHQHPAVMTWEIFNEPEGMTTEFGWSDERTTMPFVQRFINLCAGAIHRTAPGALVSNGSWSFRASSDISGFTDFYRDDKLIAAGGDPEGTLDFIQVHYYDHIGIDGSPFHHPASYWNIDKPIIIGEFPAGGILGFSVEECYQYAYRLGYAGALAWSYSDIQFGGLPAARRGMLSVRTDYPDDIIVPDTMETMTTAVLEKNGFDLTLFPNPAYETVNLQMNNHQGGAIEFQIFNSQGQIMKHGVISDYIQPNLEIANFPAGQYTIRIYDQKQLSIRHFIKM